MIFKYGNANNIEENDQTFVDRSVGNILTTRQKVQFKDETNNHNKTEIARIAHISYSQNHINNIGQNYIQPKVIYVFSKKSSIISINIFNNLL